MSNDVEWGPWIGWNGGECPIDGDTIIQAVWIKGPYTEGKARDWKWHVEHQLQYMVAYRVKKEPVIEVVGRWVAPSSGVGFPDVLATCTYRDGKLISINWEAPDA